MTPLDPKDERACSESPSESAPVVTTGDILMEKYRVERLLGTGAMGVVVSARHLTLDRVVAIKFLADCFGSREQRIQRFLGEARAAARIDSDHVCQVSDVGTTQAGVPFMVMEYLEGNDLDDELHRRGQLAIFEAVDYVLQAADAIAAAHRLGIVHRDLKPANIFLAQRPDGSRRVKLLDFGISKSYADEPRRERTSLGTPAYMSPEQVRGEDVDGRSDIWALGAILYELLTGQMAFVGDDVKAVLDMVLSDAPCPIERLRHDVPRELELVVTRALARDTRERWASVAAFSLALAPFATPGVFQQLGNLQRDVGSVPLYRTHAAPSVTPLVANIRPEVATLPDPDEVKSREQIVLAHSKGRARARIAKTLAAATALVGVVIVLAFVALQRVRATPAAAAAPPSAEPAAELMPSPPPPVTTVAKIEAPKPVESTHPPPTASAASKPRALKPAPKASANRLLDSHD